MNADNRPQGPAAGGVGTPGQDTPTGGDTPPKTRVTPTDAIGPCAYDIADIALETGRPTACPDCRLVAVPDVVLVEATANGQPVPDTYRLIRNDGRTVAMYLRPGQAVTS